MSEHYCRLYIDTDDERTRVQESVDDCLPAAFRELSVDARVLRNTGFDVRARSRQRYDPIECSPLTAEVSAIEERAEHREPFYAGMVLLISSLRTRGYLVTASCDFEDRIAKETDWNWSTRTTEPPGRHRL